MAWRNKSYKEDARIRREFHSYAQLFVEQRERGYIVLVIHDYASGERAAFSANSKQSISIAKSILKQSKATL